MGGLTGLKKELVLIILGSLMLGLVTLILSPILARKMSLLMALPFAGLLFLVMMLNIRHTFVCIIMTRSFLDPLLQRIRYNAPGTANNGLGGVLNLFVLLMVFLLVIKNPKVLSGNRFAISWVVFLGITGLTVLYSPLKSQALTLLLSLTTYAAIFVAPFFIVKNHQDKKFWIKLLFFSSFIPIGMANVGIVIHHPMLYKWDRLQGTFTHANILAFYIVLVLTLTFYILKTKIFRLSPAMKTFLWLYFADLLMVLIVTETRSAWMSFAAMALIYSILKDKKLLLFIMLGGMLMLTLPAVQSRLEDLKRGTGVHRYEQLNSWAWRMRLWESAMPSIQKKIVTGHGLGSFQYFSTDFFELEKESGAPAHNVYVELLFETGIFGLLAYITIYVIMLKAVFWRIFRLAGSASVEAAIVFSYVISYMLVCFSDNALYYLAFNWYFWFFMGVIMCSLPPRPKRTS